MTSIMAGCIIGLCMDIYQRTEIPIGAFLFGIGLVTICACKLPLFTGKVGSSNKIFSLLFILACNLIGVLAMHFLFSIENYFTLGVGCGMLMQMAVTAFKKGLSYITVLCIAAFLLSGYRHSIAMAYTLPNALDWLFVVLGNVVGAKFAYYGGVK